MDVKEQLAAEIGSFPERPLGELLEFARLLRAKAGNPQSELAVLSEPSLAKDWLTPEENAAWADL